MSLIDFSEREPKILVWFDTAFLGDMILLSASMRQAHKIWPQCRQFLISNQIGVQALVGLDYIQDFLVVEKKRDSFWKTRSKIKNFLIKIGCNYQDSFLMLSHRSTRSFFLTSLLGIRRIGFRRFDFCYLKYSVPYVSVLHEVNRKVLLLEGFNKSRDQLFVDLKPELKFNLDLCKDEFKNWILKSKKSKSLLVGIAPGSVWATKQYPKEYFASVSEKILAEYRNACIILIGGKNDIGAATFIVDVLKQQNFAEERILNTVGESSLEESKYLISNLHVLICNDSAPNHIASAFDIPSITIFGPTMKEYGFESLSLNHISLGMEGLYCRPCGSHGHMSCPEKHFKCMTDLKPDVVMNAFRNLLESLHTDKM